MNCFSCFQSQKSRKENESPTRQVVEPKVPETKKQKPAAGGDENIEIANIEAQCFTFRELATATKNFRQECLLGEGGFGRVYKGTLASTGQVVAVKQLDRNGLQKSQEFLGEILKLSLLHHPNLVNLIGYCADGDQRLLVHELMSGGSLDAHLLDMPEDRKPLNWFTRMRIAFGAAKGLEYLHEKADPPVIYRDLKPSNILLDEEYTPKLSYIGLDNLGPNKSMHVSSRVVGTYGYCAPEYARAGEITQKSDVYSFGVILLELITGRRAIDTKKPNDEQNLVTWAQPKFRDPKTYPDMADPLLEKQFPEKDLNQVVAIASMCLQEESSARPLMSDVVTALSFLSMAADHMPHSVPPTQYQTLATDDREQQESGVHQDISDENDNDSSRVEESSDQEDGDSDDQETVTESKNLSKESTKDSRVSLSHKSSSRRLPDSVRSSHCGSVYSDDEGSSRRSQPNASLSRGKSSKNPLHSLSQKSSSRGSKDGSISSDDNDDDNSYSSSGRSRPSDAASLSNCKGSKKSLHSLSHKSCSRKSQSRNSSHLSFCISLDSEDGIGSISYRSSIGSQNSNYDDR